MLVGTLFFSAAEKSLAGIPLPLHLSPANQSQTGEAEDVVGFCILTSVPYMAVYANILKLYLLNCLG